MAVSYDALKELKESLTEEQVCTIMKRLGASQFYDSGKSISFPSICHNEDESDSKFNLVYYKNNHLFRCFSECSESFDIYGMVKRRFQLDGEDTYIDNLYYFVLNYSGIDLDSFSSVASDKHKAIAKNYEVQPTRIKLPEYNSNALGVFIWRPVEEWLRDGISKEAMKKYNILYSISRNKVIIPHYDIDGRLVGIRGRALNEDEAKKYGKYMPVKIEKNYYAHPLGFTLYGLNEVKDRIEKYGMVIVAESEKSALQAETFLGEYNTTVATCGSVLNRWQVLLLIESGAKEIVIAFDREDKGDGKYFDKLYNMCKKYNEYCNFSFIYDNTILEMKDSPFDKGKEVFLQLLQKRVKVK